MTMTKDKIQYLDPKILEIPPVRITSVFDEDVEKLFEADIKKEGIEDPLKIGKSDGHLWVIDGLHRREQALLNGIALVPCIVREIDLVTIQLRNFVSNRLRGKTKMSEEIRMIGDLYTTHGVKIEDIVSKTAMPRERLETMILISQAHPAILEALDEDRIKFCHATELIRLQDQDKQFVMLGLTTQYHPKCHDLAQWVTETIKEIQIRKDQPIVAGPESAPKVPTAPCACCLKEIEVRQLSNPFLCRGCYAELITAHQEHLRKEAHAVLKATSDDGSPLDIRIDGGAGL